MYYLKYMFENQFEHPICGCSFCQRDVNLTEMEARPPPARPPNTRKIIASHASKGKHFSEKHKTPADFAHLPGASVHIFANLDNSHNPSCR